MQDQPAWDTDAELRFLEMLLPMKSGVCLRFAGRRKSINGDTALRRYAATLRLRARCDFNVEIVAAWLERHGYPVVRASLALSTMHLTERSDMA